MSSVKLGALRKLDAIEAWQHNDHVHPLTCGNDSNHELLVAKMVPTSNVIVVSSDQGSKIILKCPDCDYVQEHVPEIVYETFIANEFSHKIPLGQVVDVELDDTYQLFYGEDYVFPKREHDMLPEMRSTSPGVKGDREIALGVKGTARLLIVGHTRDCDGEPLYACSDLRVKFGVDEKGINEVIAYRRWCAMLLMHRSESGLTVVEGEFIPLLYDSIYDYEDEMRQSLRV